MLVIVAEGSVSGDCRGPTSWAACGDCFHLLVVRLIVVVVVVILAGWSSLVTSTALNPGQIARLIPICALIRRLAT